MGGADKAGKYIRRISPAALCDACLVEPSGARNSDGAARLARELAGSDGFERRIGDCAMCRAARVVTRWRPGPAKLR